MKVDIQSLYECFAKLMHIHTMCHLHLIETYILISYHLSFVFGPQTPTQRQWGW